MVDTERFANTDGGVSIRWEYLVSVGLATVILQIVYGVVDLITAFGSGITTLLGGLGSWLNDLVGEVVGMPRDIVFEALGITDTWSPTEGWGEVIPTSSMAMEWLEIFGPLALPIGIAWAMMIGLIAVWGLSKLYDAYRGDS